MRAASVDGGKGGRTGRDMREEDQLLLTSIVALAAKIDKTNKLLAYLLAVVCVALGLTAGALVVKITM